MLSILTPELYAGIASASLIYAIMGYVLGAESALIVIPSAMAFVCYFAFLALAQYFEDVKGEKDNG